MNNYGDPGLRELMNTVAREVMLSMNCHAIGTIKEFNAAKQLAKASLNYQQVFVDSEGNETVEDYPVLIDCPVFILRGGAARLTFPIAVGDPCVVAFNDRDMDIWIAKGQVAPPNTDRLHAFGDAILFVGLSNLAQPLAGYSTTSVELSHTGSKISLDASKIGISSDVDSMKTLLVDLATALKGFMTLAKTAAPATVSATVATPAATAEAQLTLIINRIGAFLK